MTTAAGDDELGLVAGDVTLGWQKGMGEFSFRLLSSPSSKQFLSLNSLNDVDSWVKFCLSSLYSLSCELRSLILS